jgi:hypothetical protein
MSRRNYLRIDEREDAINALEFVADLSPTLARKPTNWKWCLLAAHSALQGFLVCTLAGTAGIGVMDSESQKRFLRWNEDSRSNPNAEWPKIRMASPAELYRRVHDASWMGQFGGTPIFTSAAEDKDVRLLNHLRRDFVHFEPKGWSIELVGLPRLILTAIAICERLFNRPGCSFRLNQSQRRRVQRSLTRIRGCLVDREQPKSRRRKRPVQTAERG